MTRTADVPFVLIDKSGNEVSSEGFEFDITTINVTIPISMVKEVTLYVQCIYGAGATEENTSITIEPSTITISGDTSVVSSLNSINIATIDLTDFAVTLQDTYAITLPNGVENTSGVTKADVTIEIQGVSTKQVTVTNFNYTGLPDGYYVEDIITKNLEVRIRGAQDVLDQIQSSNLRAVADLSDITQTGDMYVPVKVELDGFTDAGAVGEYMIAISIRR
jgi:YbbR domain-containing protein